MTDELKPCPFCKPEASNPMPEVEYCGGKAYVFICCHGCYCRGPAINAKFPINVGAAVLAWNTRTETPK